MGLCRVRSALVLGAALWGATAAAERPSVQALVDAAAPGVEIRLEPGVYAGPVRIDKAITLDGGGQAVIDGGGHGSVIRLQTDGAQLRGLTIRGSGSSHNDLDAAIRISGNYNVIKDNVIEDCLFGIDLQQSNNNVVRRNRIRSKDATMGLRGDAIRLWYSMGNQITDNRITNARDSVIWYSQDNLIAGNHSAHGRYALHFMYAQANRVERNVYDDNEVGVFLMYSDGVQVVGNRISRSTGPTGMGVGFKETSDVTLQGNEILYCASGIYLDVSPYQPDTENRFLDNLIAYNDVGVLFHNDWTGNVFRANRLQGNITQVAVQGARTASRNAWQGNYWDDYQGFDRDGDGVGDTPYELYSYANRIWMDVPPARFFKGSPVLELLDFVERLAPFSEPELTLRDVAPRMASGRGAGS
jgi:nitrous oxidase accessory protein